MAKTIKFNLILNNNPVRNIEELQNNFSIEEILDYYHNGLLQRWLQVRGFRKHLNDVNEIKLEDNKQLIMELIKVFEIDSDEDKINEGIGILDYINERKVLLEEYEKADYKANLVIDDYHSGYDAIIADIIENKDNMPKIKANIREIEENYIGLFDLNYRELYNNLIDNAPLAIFAILMNETMRGYFIGNDDASTNTNLIYDKIRLFVGKKSILKEKLGGELKVFSGYTDGYWKDIEPQGKKIMLINMESGNFVRNAGAFGEELAASDVNNLFVMLDGIDYKSNNANHELLYMEV